MKAETQTHWRDSARSIRFFIWDGKAVFPFVLVAMWPRIWTLCVAVVATIFFTILNRAGYTPKVFLRILRSKIAGRRINAVPWWME